MHFLLGLIVFGAIGAALLLIKEKNPEVFKAATPNDGFLFQYFDTSVNTENVLAFLAVIRNLESNNRYNVIAGGDTFQDYSEHPFVINPNRNKPLGTTASGAYQQVKGTWIMARDALGLENFSPASQDAAAIWLLNHKVPGENRFNLDGTGLIEDLYRGDFEKALQNYRKEWEALDKIILGKYPIKLADAEQIYLNNGGYLA